MNWGLKASIFILTFFFLTTLVKANVVINEIMYNPSGSDDKHEWLEIVNTGSGSVNLTGWKLNESNTNHALTIKQRSSVLNPNEYAVIADDWATFLLDYTNYTKILIDSSFSLLNSGETLALKDSSGAVIDEVAYANLASEGNSICKISDSWMECLATPGEQNIALENQTQENPELNETPPTTSGGETSGTVNPELTIIFYPSQMKFGDYGIAFIKFYSGSHEYSNLKFLAYGYPSQVLMDLEGNGVTASSYNSNVAIGVNVQKNNTVYIALPVFLKQDCDNQYSDGTYRIRVRAYNSGEEITTQDFNLPVAGRNELFCPNKTKSNENCNTAQNVKSNLEIVSYPAIVYTGKDFSILVNLSFDTVKNLTVYFYVFSGHKLLSDGGWYANQKQILVNPDSPVLVELKNRIKDGVEAGNYKLRVRVEGEEDITKDIEVVEAPVEIVLNLSCREMGDKIRMNVISNQRTGADLYVFSENRMNIKRLVTNETIDFPKQNSYFILVQNSTIMGKCYVYLNESIVPTGKSTSGGFLKAIQNFFARVKSALQL